MQKKPRVSVLTPIYNTNIGHLCECIDSILNQTFTDFEFIILNDSPDNKKLKKIIDTYEDKRIKYYENKKNIGISASRNRLLELAQGEYIAIFDHDDISVPDRLARQVEFLDTHPNVGVVSGWLRWFGDRNWTHTTPEYDIDIKIHLTHESYLLHTAAMIRKSVLDEHNIKYEEKYSPAEDHRLWARLWPFTQFHNIQDVLVNYRWNGNNTSTTSFEKMQRAAKAVRLEIREEHPAFYQEFLNLHKDTQINTIVKPGRSKNWRYRLFGVIPLLKRKKKWILLFDFLPIVKIKD